jgi:hypothetical protein
MSQYAQIVHSGTARVSGSSAFFAADDLGISALNSASIRPHVALTIDTDDGSAVLRRSLRAPERHSPRASARQR